VELIQLAHGEEWPRLSRDAGEQLLQPTPGCFFGPGVGPYVESLSSVPELREVFEVMSPKRARDVFGHFTFCDSLQVIRDQSCAVVAAEATMKFLARWVNERAAVVEECQVASIEPQAANITLYTSKGEFCCDGLVVTAGSWLPSLMPEKAPVFRVAHQDVGYYEMKGSKHLPVWVYLPENGEPFYGLPSFQRPGAKIARHRIGAHSDDPDRTIPQDMPLQAALELEEFLNNQFAAPASLVGYEGCLYTNTLNEDYVLDHWPGESRIVVGSACSGHGFKFAPLSGRILCQLLLDGRSTVELFEKHRDSFRWDAHKPW
jgi:sarcosine oxidase